jgi:predicted RNA-binding protein YlxR (DUF448 family)
LGCGVREEQSKLIRLVVGEGRELKVDRWANARGGYLHPDRRCWQFFLRRKSLHRAFHVEIAKETKEKLIRELTERYRE